MGIQKARSIGNPGIPGKWQQPAGTVFYSGVFTGTFDILFHILYNDGFSVTSDTVFYLDAGYSYNQNNTIVIIDLIKARFASRAWGTPGPTPRTEVRCLDNNDMEAGAGEFTATDTLIESPDCGANVEISSVQRSGLLYISNGQGFPRLRMRAQAVDFGAGGTVCVNEMRCEYRVLLPKDSIVSIPNAPGLPGQNSLTLLKET